MGNPNEAAYARLVEDMQDIAAEFKRYQIAKLKSYRAPEFNSRNPEYLEMVFNRPLNMDLFEAIIRFINERTVKHGRRVSARIVEDEEQKENIVVLVPHSETPRNIWLDETRSFMKHMRSGIKDYQTRAGHRVRS